MLNGKMILPIILLSFYSTFLIFSNIEEAQRAYENENFNESMNLYNLWLNNNTDSDDFFKILNELSNNKGDIFLLTDILEKHIQNVSDKKDRKLMYEKIAQIYELTSNLEKAQIYYQKASLILLNNPDFKLLLKSVELLLLQGDYFQAETQLKEILFNNAEININIHANIFYVLLNILNSGNLDQPQILSSEDPQYLYISYLINQLNPELDITINFEEKIIMEYEASPEASLIKKKISEMPNILISLGLLKKHNNSDSNIIIENTAELIETKTFMIQTGSFRDKENAHYLKLDLEKSGIDAIVEEQIINNAKYYKVIVYLSTEEEVILTLAELQKNGFEGFPIY